MDYSPQDQGVDILNSKSDQLFGPSANQRTTRVMVTMPGEAATDQNMVTQFLQSGMDVARINCAHDDANTWRSIVINIRRISEELGLPCRVMMDLAGPKLRTGPMPDGPQVVRARTKKNSRGRVSTWA
ncbi:MAG: pyruvate kinase [Endozoicomonas sp.]